MLSKSRPISEFMAVAFKEFYLILSFNIKAGRACFLLFLILSITIPCSVPAVFISSLIPFTYFCSENSDVWILWKIVLKTSTLAAKQFCTESDINLCGMQDTTLA